MITKQLALDYHSMGKRGKVEVCPTKPCKTQLDLSLAYTPGVAEPCLEIAKNPSDVWSATALPYWDWVILAPWPESR